jgi:hypothetical protein
MRGCLGALFFIFLAGFVSIPVVNAGTFHNPNLKSNAPISVNGNNEFTIDNTVMAFEGERRNDPGQTDLDIKLVPKITVVPNMGIYLYDPASREFYIGYWPILQAVSSKTNKVTATFHLGGYGQRYGQRLMYNPANMNVYVLVDIWPDSSNLTIINSFTHQIVKIFEFPTRASDLAYDPANENVYVTGSYTDGTGDGAVTVISSQTDQVINTLRVGHYAAGIVYVPLTRDMYMADVYTTVYEISSLTNKVVWSLSVGEPDGGGISFDPLNGNLYISWQRGSACASLMTAILSVRTKNILGTLGHGNGCAPFPPDSPTGGFAYNPVNKNTYFYGGIYSSSYKLIGRLDNSGLVYDPTTRSLVVTSVDGMSIQVVSSASNKVVASVTPSTAVSGPFHISESQDIYVISGNTLYALSITKEEFQDCQHCDNDHM